MQWVRDCCQPAVDGLNNLGFKTIELAKTVGDGIGSFGCMNILPIQMLGFETRGNRSYQFSISFCILRHGSVDTS